MHENALCKFPIFNLPLSLLQNSEELEQLRQFYAGIRTLTFEITPTSLEPDTQGSLFRVPALMKIDVLGNLLTMEEVGVTKAQTACIGDDSIDLPALDALSLSYTVADEPEYTKRQATGILKNAWGYGAFCELVD